MKLVKRCKEMEIISPFYGVAWVDWLSRDTVCMPVPLNLIAALARGAWIYLRHGYRSVPVSPRDAYHQGRKDAKKYL